MTEIDRGSDKIRIAISSCLLGEAVRYNGGHKQSQFCTDALAKHFQFVPFCPEVAIGLGVPREAIRLVGELDQPRAVGTKTLSMDVTAPLLNYAAQVTSQVAECRGYLLMKDSPSCGLYSTKVYTEKGVHGKKRAGLFAGHIRGALPLLPMEESGRLNDPALRENFVARVYVYDAWLKSVAAEPTAKALVEFHSRHKYFVMSFSQRLYRQLGQMVATAGVGSIDEVASQYIEALMIGTAKPPTRRGHVNVLYHLLGYLKESVPGGIRQDLTEAVEEYRKAQVPLAVPMKLMAHYLQHYASDYIRGQTYLHPYPYELGLRNAL